MASLFKNTFKQTKLDLVFCAMRLIFFNTVTSLRSYGTILNIVMALKFVVIVDHVVSLAFYIYP